MDPITIPTALLRTLLDATDFAQDQKKYDAEVARKDGRPDEADALDCTAREWRDALQTGLEALKEPPRLHGLNSVQIVTRAMQPLGHQAFTPEGLHALKASVDEWGWKGTAALARLDERQLRDAYADVIEMMRAMFAPVGSAD